jgi:pentatricopeptide repeat domain-containing protein 1
MDGHMSLPSVSPCCSSLQGCKPDAIVYNAIIDALWETGVSWAQVKALHLYKAAVKQGYFHRDQPRHGGHGGNNGHRAEVNLHALTAGVAMLSLYCWVNDLK